MTEGDRVCVHLGIPPPRLLRGVAEFSVYVARAARGRGAGRLAMQSLMEEARKRGFLEARLSRVRGERREPGAASAASGSARSASTNVMRKPAASGATSSSSKRCSPNPDLITRRTFSFLARCLGAVATAILIARCGGGKTGPSGTRRPSPRSIRITVLLAAGPRCTSPAIILLPARSSASAVPWRLTWSSSRRRRSPRRQVFAYRVHRTSA